MTDGHGAKSALSQSEPRTSRIAKRANNSSEYHLYVEVA